MGGAAPSDEAHAQLAFLEVPVGAPGSGGVRYAAAMYFYQQGLMSAEMLEVYRQCSKFDDEDPVDLARFEGVANSVLISDTTVGQSA